MCVSINGSGDLELWPFDQKLVCESHLRWGNLHSDFGTLGLCVLELFRHVRDGRIGGQTDGQTKATLTAPFPMGGGIISWCHWLVYWDLKFFGLHLFAQHPHWRTVSTGPDDQQGQHCLYITCWSHACECVGSIVGACTSMVTVMYRYAAWLLPHSLPST